MVLLTVGAGAIVAIFKVLPKQAFKMLNGFVFKVALPALVCRGIGLKTDLYEDGIWRFIGAFLLLRCVALIVAVASAFMQTCVPSLHTLCVLNFI
jgi:predicted permease